MKPENSNSIILISSNKFVFQLHLLFFLTILMIFFYISIPALIKIAIIIIFLTYLYFKLTKLRIETSLSIKIWRESSIEKNQLKLQFGNNNIYNIEKAKFWMLSEKCVIVFLRFKIKDDIKSHGQAVILTARNSTEASRWRLRSMIGLVD